jgi:hypothetical protein
MVPNAGGSAMSNMGNIFGNAAGGAASGFSMGGPWGAAAGGGLGLLLGILAARGGKGGGGFGGSNSEFQTLPTMNPEQMEYLQQILSGLQGGASNVPGMEYLTSLFSNNPNAFKEYEAPAFRQFNEQILPGIAERFTGTGAGSRSSSAFNNSAAMAGSRLSENLAAQRANLRGNAVGQLQNYGQQALNPTFENLYAQGQPGLLQGIAGGIGQGAGALGSQYLMKKFGMM